MKTATKTVTLQSLGLNGYEVDGRAYVSMSEIARATRDNKSTRPVQTFLDTAENTSEANGSQGFPQEFDTAAFECIVPHESGTKVAHLIAPGMAWNFIVSELSNRSTDVVGRALVFVKTVGDAGFTGMVQQELGLRSSVTENLTAAVRLQADLSLKAPDIQRLKLAMYKALLPHIGFESVYDLPKDDRRYPIFREIKEVINSVYSRLDEGVHDAIKVVKKNTPHSAYKRPTKYSCLTEEARTALKPVVNAYITAFSMLNAPGTVLDVKRIIENIDRIYPRYA